MLYYSSVANILKSRRNGKKKVCEVRRRLGLLGGQGAYGRHLGQTSRQRGGTKEPVLSPFALVGVRVASAVLVVLLSLGVVALGLFHRFSQQRHGRHFAFESGACAGDARVLCYAGNYSR